MQSRPRVALLIETSNAYARDLLHGIRATCSNPSRIAHAATMTPYKRRTGSDAKNKGR